MKTATSSVSITASPIAGTPPGAPTGLTANAGNAQVSLSWTAPASNGGVAITSYRVYRGTSSGAETLLTTGGCSGLGAVLSCNDTGLTNGQTYYYKVSAVNSLGEGPQSNEASRQAGQRLHRRATAGQPRLRDRNRRARGRRPRGVVSNNTTQPARTGSWKAWLDGYGTTHTDTLSQSVTLPTGCTNYKFNFYMHIDTAETTTTTKYDTLQLQALNSSGTVLATSTRTPTSTPTPATACTRSTCAAMPGRPSR